MSLQINNILYPTDFSEASEKALVYALEIAKTFKARVYIVHSIEEPYDFAPLVEDYKQNISRKVENLLQMKLEELADDNRYKNLTINSRILHGRTDFAVMEEAEELQADLVVMGTTGASGLEKVFMGSKTIDVMLQSKIPVLAVPENCDFDGFDHITFLTDYNDGDLNALQHVADLGKAFSSKITSVHIEKELNLKKEIMHRGFKDIASKQVSYETINYELLTADNFLDGVNEFLNMQKNTLLTLVKYKKSFFNRLFNKDHSKELSFSAKFRCCC